MTAQLHALRYAAHDPALLARFWAGVLGWEADPAGGPGWPAIVPTGDDTGLRIRFVATTAAKTGPNQVHFDLTSSSAADQQATVERALALGGAHLDIGQTPEEGHVVLQDPEGNEFCVIEAGNGFLAGCGVVGALSGDGTEAVGRFWSRALDWPLVWDQDEETAIQSPQGGTKLTWGGPPVNPKTGVNRLQLELVVDAEERQSEVDRLVALGARVDDAEGSREAGAVGLLDPDGNEFVLRDR